jgi:hypothetical protein
MEGLEGRQLLNGQVPNSARSIHYVAPGGGKVTVQVLGNGSLLGTTVDTDGALKLVYSGTNAASLIRIDVRGGRNIPLRSVNNLFVPSNNYSGIGGQLLGSLLGPKVDLVNNGSINLTSGIGRLQLHAIGRNTQVHLRELPQTVQPTSSSFLAQNTVNTIVGSGSTIIATAAPTGIVRPLPPGTQAASQSVPATQIAPATFTEGSQTLSYSNDANGGSTLRGITGQFSVYPPPTPPAADPPPPGIVVQLNQINAGTPGQQPLGDGQIYGYDPTVNALIRFDAVTGAVTGTIPVGGTATTSAGVGLGRNGRELVVLLGRGTTVQAFDASTGAPVGQFSAATVNGVAFTGITGIGFNELTSVLTDANAQLVPGSANFGVASSIDVAASLATGVTQAVGNPYGTVRALEFAGGTAGLAQNTNIYAPIAAHFDSFQFDPTLQQAGMLTLANANLSPTELARTAIPNAKGADPFTNVGTAGTTRTSGTTKALGSVEQLLALNTGVVNGTNVVSLLVPGSFATAGAVALNDPNLLVSLSNSFHPELAGSALFDVQGGIQSFTVRTVHGLALNDSGNLNLLQINSLNDSTIVGQPFGHLRVGHRNNVTIVTPNRAVGARQEVIVNPKLRPLGPLSLPN